MSSLPASSPVLPTGAIKGIDASAVQGLLSGDKLKAQGFSFAYLRCGVGNDGADMCFSANVRVLRAAGVVVGPYHFFYPLPVVPGHESRAPEAQAAAHVKAAAGCGVPAGDLPPMLDLEWPAPEDWHKWGCTADSIKTAALAYLREYERLTGVRPGIYEYPYFEVHLAPGPEFDPYRLWEASYQNTPARMRSAPWIWQYTGGGGRMYNGAPVDLDVIDQLAFQALLDRP